MDHKIKVTVTVAVYNTEKYIKRCLDSLVAQTLKELEIIIVDDGSTDNSGKICDEYALKDDRIRVIHKENDGLGSARQVGLENAHGEYFIACDSDDWVEPTMYEDMFSKAENDNVDMVICDYYYNYPNGKESIYHEYCTPKSKNEIVKAVLLHKISNASWNKLVKTEFYRRYRISWELGINQGEDALILFKKLQYPIKISFMSKALYHYWRDMKGGSYTNNISLSTFGQSYHILDWLHNNEYYLSFTKELFIRDIEMAFTGLRTKGMTKDLYNRYCLSRLTVDKFSLINVRGLKSLIVYISTINFKLAKTLVKKTYHFFYR